MATNSFISAVSRRLEGKVALITGGASGIGETTARIFGHHGAKVVIADIQDDLGKAVASSILPRGTASYVHCDVTNESHIASAVDEAVRAHGGLDIMFNNAGIGGPNEQRIVDNERSDFDNVLAVGVTGVFLGIKHAARVMVSARKGGSIISTASISSIVGGAASHAYTCSKHAVAGLTKNAAVELGKFGIRVNCLSPYVMATPLATSFVGIDEKEIEEYADSLANLKGVTLKSEDVANAALFLSCDEGRYISGHNLVIDGGFSVVNPSFEMFKYD